MAVYIDDYFTTTPHYASYKFSVDKRVSLFTRLWFVIHPIYHGTTARNPLWFIVNSVHKTEKGSTEKMVNQLLTI